jgi:alkylation response protein AidB-like acyl-CoA dehydrogenase
MVVRQWFEREYPAEMRYLPRRVHWHESRDWYMKLVARGWAAPGWPREYGGMGLTPAKLLIFMEEQERWGVARTPDMGIIMVGPLLIKHGTEEQRAEWLPPSLKGEYIWCQGYSEPNAGSDLASLRMEAVVDGDDFVVNGQKIWTTLAQDASHIFLLVRTDKNAKKQAGISFLLADMKSPGITVRPIRNLAGHEEFCEVFFDNVRVPRKNMVGEPNKGWTMAKALLSFERIFLGSPKQCQNALKRLNDVAHHAGLFNEAGFVERYTKLKLDVQDLETLYARYAAMVKRGETLGPDVSMLKIWGTETFAALSELVLEAAGAQGAVLDKANFGEINVEFMSMFYNARPATIYGGSNEIQRNIIGDRVLGLPREPMVDKNMPFKDLKVGTIRS